MNLDNLNMSDIIVSNVLFIHVIPIFMTFLYFTMIYYLPGICIRNKEFIQRNRSILKLIIFMHNSALCITSTIGAFYFIRDIWAVFYYQGGLLMISCDPHGDLVLTKGKYHLLAIFFPWSKFWEFFDTAFLIIKKPERPILLLQWWHHITVMIFTWYATVYMWSAGFVFAGNNLIVHAVMYFYFAKATIATKPKWGKLITLLQISQMFIGIFFLCAFSYYIFIGYDCYTNINPMYFIIYGFIMYGSYLYLFVLFFMNRYMKK